jgi:hypothetical protein
MAIAWKTLEKIEDLRFVSTADREGMHCDVLLLAPPAERREQRWLRAYWRFDAMSIRALDARCTSFAAQLLRDVVDLEKSTLISIYAQGVDLRKRLTWR